MINKHWLSKVFFLFLSFIIQFFFLVREVDAQYAFGTSTPFIQAGCNLANNTPQMSVWWSDLSTLNADEEIWRSDGSLPAFGSGDGLKAFYFSNKNLAGTAIKKTTVSQVNFNWGTGSPYPEVSADGDNFSASWEGYIEAPQTGNYILSADVNDGAKLIINNDTKFDKLITNNNLVTYQSGSISFIKGSRQAIKFQFTENTGSAEVHLYWTYDTGNSGTSQLTRVLVPQNSLYTYPVNHSVIFPSTPLPQKTIPDGLKGFYFPNKDLAGAPIMTSVDSPIRFNTWSTGSPDPLLPNDNFSVRWSGQVLIPNTTGDYTFYVNVNDGARLLIDGVKVIDKWRTRSNAAEFTSTPIKLAAATRHNIVLEYFEDTGDALVELRWSGPNTAKDYIPTANLFSSPVNQDISSLQYNTSGGFLGYYFNSVDLSGTPVLTKVE